MNNFKPLSSLDSKKVLVTGGAGFIGSHICEELLKMGAKVIALDDMSAGRQANINFLEKNPNYKFIKGSVNDTGKIMEDIFNGLDVVFHNAASKKNICLDNPQKDLLVNAGGTLNLLLFAHKFGVRKFIHASTGSVYGEPKIFPTNEEHPFNPVSYYGVSKLAGERYVDTFHSLYGINTTILRYFHVYGPRQESNEFGGVVSIFMKKISNNQNPIVFGDGEQIRSFTFVKDLVNVNIKSALMEQSKGKAYNVASGISVSINDLATKMIEFSGKKHLKPEYSDPLIGDVRFFNVDNKNVINDLSVEFNTDFWGTLKDSLKNIDNFLSLDK